MMWADKELLHRILKELHRINWLLTHQAYGFGLNQLGGGMITGVAPGATGTFQISLLPAGAVPLSTGPLVSVDDAAVVLGAVDPTTLEFTATVPATDTGSSFNLTVSGVNGAGTAISTVFNVPILPATPPPPVQATGFGLNQLS